MFVGEGDAQRAFDATAKAVPDARPVTLVMVPLIPLKQSCRLNLQSVRFAIPVGDPRMV
jgi:hypothetical protein